MSMLETKSPKLEPFERCVRGVFTGMLTLCGVAADYKGKGRFRKWLRNTVEGGEDPVLAGAYATVEDAIGKLGAAVGVATLRTVVEIQETTTRLEGKADVILDETVEVGATTHRIEHGVSAVREGVEDLGLRFDGVSASIRNVDRQHAMLVSKLDFLLLQSPAQHAAEKKKTEARKGDSGGKRYRALARVKRHFADVAETHKKISALCKYIDNSTVESTGEWLFKHDSYQRWVSGTARVLWLSGEAGVGKTYLARAIARNIQRTKTTEGISVANFFFGEVNGLGAFKNALRCSVLEIAKNNHLYCETIAAEIANDADEEPWKQFFADRFPASSEAHLYLVLDSADEASDGDLHFMAQVLKEASQDHFNIHICFTGRSKLRSVFVEMNPVEISLDRDLMKDDMRKLTRARMKGLPRVHKFQKMTKKRIAEKVMLNADGMLYIEHMLRRLSAIGRESAVIRDIENPLPKSLEELYKLMLEECQKGRTQQHYQTLRTLFATLAFSERNLTLDEATDLVHLVEPDGSFDIEDELVGRSARILELGREQDDEENALDEDEHATASSDDDATRKEIEEGTGKTPLSFQERSLREYFRSMNVNERGLRTPPSEANAIVFALLVRILCDAPVETGDKETKFQGYAAHFWLHHFCEINASEITDSLFDEALTGLHRILNKDGKAALAIETWGPQTYEKLDAELKLLPKLQLWFSRATERADLDPAMKAWAAIHVEEPRKAFVSLARSHFKNLFATETSNGAMTCFWYAKSALLAAGIDVAAVPKGSKDVLQVLEYFKDIELPAAALASVAAILARRYQHNESMEFSYKGLSLTESTDTVLRFRLLWSIAWNKQEMGVSLNNRAASVAAEAENGANAHDVVERNHGDNESIEQASGGAESVEEKDSSVEQQAEELDGLSSACVAASQFKDDDDTSFKPGPGQSLLEEALSIISGALALLPEGKPSDEKLAEQIERILLLRALCEQNAGQYDKALSTYEEHRAIRPGVDTMIGASLNGIFMVKNWSKDPQGALDLIARWSDLERTHFFEYLFTRDYLDACESLDLIQEYATKAGDAGMDQLLSWWDGYIKKMRKRSAFTVIPKSEMAAFYRDIRDDRETAMQLYGEILSTDFKYDDYDGLESDLLFCRLSLATSIFVSFRSSSDPKRKFELLENMKNLPNLRTSGEEFLQNEDSWNESQTLVMLAMMTRTVGSPVEYQQLLNKAFDIAIVGLTDSVGHNDSDSFRLLARILAYVPGLAKDAQIALSCQFSITDTSVDHGSGESEDNSEAGENLQPRDKKEPLHASEESAEGTHILTEITKKTTTITTEESADSSEPTVSVAVELAKLTTLDPVDDESADDEDRIPDWSLWCDGPCDLDSIDWKNYPHPTYFCIQCGNCDLCEDCYQVSLRIGG